MKKTTIICVDDEKIVLDSLKKELLNSFPDQVSLEFAESGMEALELINELTAESNEISIIICDWQMPEMKGDEFLALAHKIIPDTKKILLTGQATQEGIGNAVNKSDLFRYMPKPWEPADLDITITEAFRSFYSKKKNEQQQNQLVKLNASLEDKVKRRTNQLMNSKDELNILLNKTLKGSIDVLVNLFSQTDELIFAKATRIKDVVRRMLPVLDVPNHWEFEVGALMSQIGSLHGDDELLERFYMGEAITEKERVLINQYAEGSYNILIKLPMFDNLATAIRGYYNLPKLIKTAKSERVILIAKVLNAAINFDNLVLSQIGAEQAIKTMKTGIYDSRILYSLEESFNVSNLNDKKEEPKNFRDRNKN